MRPNNWSKFDPTQIADTFASVRNDLAKPLQRVVADMQSMLVNGLMLRDNAYCALVSMDCVHGVETPFANPLGAGRTPIGFELLTCENAIGQPFEYSGAPVAVAGPPQLNRRRPDGFLGLTVQYAPPLGAIGVRTGAAQVISHNSNTAITWTNQTHAVGTNIVWDGATRLTCAVAGLVRCSWNLWWDTAAGDTRRDGAVYHNNAVDQWVLLKSAGDFCFMSGAYSTIVAAGDYLRLVGFQTTGGNLDLYNAATPSTAMQAEYIAPDPSTTARVTGILWGG